MNHLKLILASLAVSFLSLCASAMTDLPGQTDMPAVDYDYFPTRTHAFVFRNWTLVPPQRLAEVLGTTPGKVRRIARSMGLDPKPEVDPVWLSSRGYITVLRRNWHLLPYEQILTLLDMPEEELAWKLQEDDFLFVKLGSMKPHCETLSYEAPDRAVRTRAREIRRTVREVMGGRPGMTPRFDLFKDARMDLEIPGTDQLRMVFSYSAEYGDPLMDEAQSSYSEELLASLQKQGINAVWVHSVLRMLVPPSGPFPGDSLCEKRIANLNTLVRRAGKYGIKVLLYVNEPRAMPLDWFDTEERKSLGGVEEGGFRTLCTSNPLVLDWIRDSYHKVFSEVPGLGGVFTITASENLTSCASHYGQSSCPSCKDRDYADIIAGVNNAIAEGVRSAQSDARVIAWDWGWPDGHAHEIIDRLSKDCMLMSVSEWSLPIERGGVQTSVGEYSISAVGPGPRAVSNWEHARKTGLKTVAKVMANASWELGSVPVIPAVELISRHARNLAGADVDGVVMSWSVGGYPSVNLSIFGMLMNDPDLSLGSIAASMYGPEASESVEKAWHCFSQGFSEYPYNINCLYYAPHHVGPANPFFLEPTGYRASMVGLPYDDLQSWVSVFPPEVYAAQMRKVADGFAEGISFLEEALKAAPAAGKHNISVDITRARAIRAHFLSAANHVRFTDARNRGDVEAMKEAAADERVLASGYFDYVLVDPTLGYESSNHYFFVPQDIVEKVINLDWIESRLR